MTTTPEAPNDASELLSRTTEEVYAEIRHELKVIRNRLGLLVDCDRRESAASTALFPPLPNDTHKCRLLSQIAADIYALRRRRNRHLPASLVGEPAWDVLLSFFMEPTKSLTVGNACLAADVPQTTGLRWITLLEQEGLLERGKSEDDRRRVILRLSDKGYRMMEECLGSMLSL